MCQAYLSELQIVMKNFVSYLRAVLFVTIILVTTAKDDFWWLATIGLSVFARQFHRQCQG